MSLFKFQLTGKTALLMHNDDVESADDLKLWRNDKDNKNMSVAGDDRSPPWTWMTYLYHDGNRVVMPAENLMACLRAAGAKITLKGNKTFKQLSQSGLFITEEHLAFESAGNAIDFQAIAQLKDKPFRDQAEAAKRLGFRLFVKRAAVNKTKHVRVRPRFDSWKVQGEIQVLAAEITKDILEEMFEEAGKIGLGDWRPGCKTPGPFGMFDAAVKKG